MTTPYALNAYEKEYALDMFARGKPLCYVKKQILKLKGLTTTTPKQKQQLDYALRQVNPNHNRFSEKHRRRYYELTNQYANDRKRATTNIKTEFLYAIENDIEETAAAIVKRAVENIDEPSKLKTLIEVVNLLVEDDQERHDDKPKPEPTPDTGENEKLIADLEKFINDQSNDESPENEPSARPVRRTPNNREIIESDSEGNDNAR